MSEFQNKFEGISFKPSQVMFSNYVLMDCYGKAEAEEAMARIISLQQVEDKWLPVRYYDLMKQINADFQAFDNAVLVENKNIELKSNYDRERRRIGNRLKSWFLGMEVVKEPTYAEVPEKPEITPILLLGPEAVNVGLSRLINDGYLEKSMKDGYDYLLPTEKALAKLQEKGFVASGDE